MKLRSALFAIIFISLFSVSFGAVDRVVRVFADQLSSSYKARAATITLSPVTDDVLTKSVVDLVNPATNNVSFYGVWFETKQVAASNSHKFLVFGTKVNPATSQIIIHLITDISTDDIKSTMMMNSKSYLPKINVLSVDVK